MICPAPGAYVRFLRSKVPGTEPYQVLEIDDSYITVSYDSHKYVYKIPLDIADKLEMVIVANISSDSRPQDLAD
jgi:ribose 1,5-bisphosphokinase PhnN